MTEFDYSRGGKFSVTKTVDPETGFETINIDPGHNVVCDSCDADWTERPESGGIMFQSKAICPTCTPKWLERIAKYNEEHFLRGYCPESMSFSPTGSGTS